MKPANQVTCLVADYGTFVSLAAKLSETFAKVYYFSPIEQEFNDLATCIEGYGIPGIERLDQPLDPDVLDEIDLLVVPDRGFSGLQRHFRALGKAVWGSMDVYELEDYRTQFIAMLDKIGLPHVKSKTIKGVTALAEYLKTVEDKYVKINRYRGDMETWHHIDYVHSAPELNRLALLFGGARELVVFVVQDAIPTDIEIGYDGWCVDGQYPASSFQGYELKNELYLGSLLPYAKLPEQVREINEAMAPVIKKAGYRNFIATEIRVKDDIGYFIDPTMRMPGQTGEHLLETCTNLAEVIWQGARGILIPPEFSHKFAAEATMHYAGDDSHEMVVSVPKKAERWTKLYHYYTVDGVCYFPPRRNDEVGVVIGLGNTIEAAIGALKQNFEAFKGEPVKIHTAGFAELIDSINAAQAEGIKFTNQAIPKPEIAIQ